jgi:uncharacterized damage-inducible protein DinB
MIKSIREFEEAWGQETEATLKLLHALTDASLAQAVGPKDRTLGRMAWHIAGSIPEMMNRTGLTVAGPGEREPVPASAAMIVGGYETAARSLAEAIRQNWTDATLSVVDDMYGMKWPRGLSLQILMNHQTHHRGQMTVLMRQAGLAVPGVYGPAREEWAGMGAPPPEV